MMENEAKREFSQSRESYRCKYALRIPTATKMSLLKNMDSREAHITTSTKTDSLKQGKCSVIISRATGLRLTLT